MEIKEIIDSLGIPENNKNLSLQEIIDAVLKKNHPEKPEVSDISDTKLSVIDDNRKAVITLMDMNAPPFYSNILIMAETEKELLSKSLFRNIRLTKKISTELEEIKISALFYIPVNEYLETNNYTKFYLMTPESICEKANALDILLYLIKTTKGLVSVTVDNGKSAETISLYDILNAIQ